MSQTVYIKAVPDCLIFHLDPDVPFDWIVKDLSRQIQEADRFFHNLHTAVRFLGRDLKPEEELTLLHAITDHSTIHVICVLS